MSKLVCPCGNSKTWYGAYQNGDVQTATCGACGRTVTKRGGTKMGEVRGGMRQTR